MVKVSNKMNLLMKVLILLLIDYYINVSFKIEGEIILQNDFAKLISYDKTLVDITSFNFYKKSRNFAALNSTYVTFQDIVSDDQTRIRVAALQLRGNEYKKTVIDFAIGICTVYKANKFGSMSLIKNSNLTGCPFPKGAYYINDIAPNSELLPPFMPEGKWLLDVTFTYYEKTMTRVHWMLTITKKLF